MIIQADSGHTRIGTSIWVHNGEVWRFDMHRADSPYGARHLVDTIHERVSPMTLRR